MLEKVIIKASERRFFGSAELKEVTAYKDLLFLLVKRDITAKYKQSALGILWAVVRPVFSMLVFTIIFGRLAKIDPGQGIPYALFSYAALLPWGYFSSTFLGSTSSLIGNQGIFTKVYFPRVIIPLTPVLSGLLDFSIAFLLSFVLLFWYKIPLSFTIFYVPLLLLLLMIFVTGIGFWLSALAIQYRDVQHFSGFIVQILMYVSPIIYPLSFVPEKFQLLYSFYPMVGIIEGFRSAIIGVAPMPWLFIGTGTLVSFFIFYTGLLFFSKRQKVFADVV